MLRPEVAPFFAHKKNNKNQIAFPHKNVMCDFAVAMATMVVAVVFLGGSYYASGF